MNNLYCFFRSTAWRKGVIVMLPIAMTLVESCQDEMVETIYSCSKISFSPSDTLELPGTRADRGEGYACTMEEDSLLGVLPLQAEDGGEELYLHAFQSESAGRNEQLSTRAAPVVETDFYESFGVLASVYSGAWDEHSCLSDYMYNVKVTKASSWTTTYHWPGGGRNVRFFAYAPYNSEGVALSDKSVAGTPEITYSVPAEVLNQKDLLVAVSGDMPGNTSSAASLTFGHALTAVRFVTGDDMLPGSVSKITLKGVYGKAVYRMGSGSWQKFSGVTDFSQTLKKEVGGQHDEEITGGGRTFMMLPQHLPSDASIEVVYTDRLTLTQRTLKTSIAGKIWPMGKTITYRISTTSISVVPKFSVTVPGNFTYKGGSISYLVTSQATVSGGDGSLQNVNVSWSAEFVEEDGSGGYRIISRPIWLSSFIESGNGGPSQSYTATVDAQNGKIENPHNNLLQAAEDINIQTGENPYNLSNGEGKETVENTANCYLINAPGVYSLPLVYGNGIKGGRENSSAYRGSFFKNHYGRLISNPYIYNNLDCTPTDAILIWQDAKDLVTGVRLSQDKMRLEFKVEGLTIRQGNAIVAVRRNGVIMWSWHIWVTDYRLGDGIKTIYSRNNREYKMMPVNIGWCDGETTTYEQRQVLVRFTQTGTRKTIIVPLIQKRYEIIQKGNNPYFQFGRKDPMLGSFVMGSSSPTAKTCYASNGYRFVVQSGLATIAEGIKRPHVFYHDGTSLYSSEGRNWTWEQGHQLWGCASSSVTPIDESVNKTIYDPSPCGYCLPASGVFSATTFDGNEQGLDRKINADKFMSDFLSNGGGYFYCRRMKEIGRWDMSGGTIFFPASYGLGNKRGGITPKNYYWTATAANKNSAPCFSFWDNRVSPPGAKVGVNNVLLPRACGFSVRPVKE